MSPRAGTLMRIGATFLLAALVAARISAQPAPEAQRLRDLLAADKGEEALALAREWTLARPADPEALAASGRLHARLGRFEGALDAFDAAYFVTHDPAMLVEKGLAYLEWGRPQDAERTFREALHPNDTYAPAHAALGRAMLERGNLAEAQAAAQVALAIDQSCAPAHVVMARLAIAERDYASALERLRTALQADPANLEALLWLGGVTAMLGRRAEAEAHWRGYIAVAPGTPAAWLLARGFYPLEGRPFPCAGQYPAFSPDGQYLAFRGRTDTGSAYLAPADRPDQVTRLHEGAGVLYSLDWSPDGRRLLAREYAPRTENGKQRFVYSLLVMTPGQEPAVSRIYEGAYVGACCWTPGGLEVIFDGYLPGQGRGLLALSAAGGAPRLAMAAQRGETLTGCVFSADGKRQLLQRWWQQERTFQLVLVDPADRAKDEVVARGSQQFQFPTFARDGKLLLYLTRSGGTWDLTIQPAAAGAPGRTLFRNLRSLMPPAFTADRSAVVLYTTDQLMIHQLGGVR